MKFPTTLDRSVATDRHRALLLS